MMMMTMTTMMMIMIMIMMMMMTMTTMMMMMIISSSSISKFCFPAHHELGMSLHNAWLMTVCTIPVTRQNLWVLGLFGAVCTHNFHSRHSLTGS